MITSTKIVFKGMAENSQNGKIPTTNLRLKYNPKNQQKIPVTTGDTTLIPSLARG